MTRIDMFKEVLEVVKNAEMDAEVQNEAVKYFTDYIEKDEAKNGARRKAAEEILTALKAVITDEYQTGAQLTELVNDYCGGEYSRPQITPRLTTLYKEGIIDKKEILNEDNKNVMGYALKQ